MQSHQRTGCSLWDTGMRPLSKLIPLQYLPGLLGSILQAFELQNMFIDFARLRERLTGPWCKRSATTAKLSRGCDEIVEGLALHSELALILVNRIAHFLPPLCRGLLSYVPIPRVSTTRCLHKIQVHFLGKCSF